MTTGDDDALERARAAARERTRLYRQRQADGLVRLTVWVDAVRFAEALRQGGRLAYGAEDDRPALEGAMQHIADSLAPVIVDDDAV